MIDADDGEQLSGRAVRAPVPVAVQLLLSRVVAYDWLVSLVFMPLGYVAAAPLADAIGTDTTLIGLAALNASACVGILLVPSVRNMRRPDADAASAETAEPIGADVLEEANPA